MNVKKVYLLCDLCKECDFDDVVRDETGESYPLLGEHQIIAIWKNYFHSYENTT